VTKNRDGQREPLSDITKKFNFNICIDTLTKEFNNLGFYYRIAWKKPYLSEQQHIKRLQFVKDCPDFGDDKWTHVLYSDEMGIQTGSNNHKV
jgi:protein associated with RNAse G/E